MELIIEKTQESCTKKYKFSDIHMAHRDHDGKNHDLSQVIIKVSLKHHIKKFFKKRLAIQDEEKLHKDLQTEQIYGKLVHESKKNIKGIDYNIKMYQKLKYNHKYMSILV